MAGTNDDTPQAEELKLPFDLRTVLAAIRRRVLLLLVIFGLALAAGAAGGMLLGQRTYQAETVLRYTPVGDRLAAAGTALQTEQNQVKITQNLARVRMLLSVPAALDKIGSALQVTTGGNSNLMVIRATWNDGAMAASLANTLRDVYLDEWLSKQAVNLRLLYDRASGEQKTMDAQAERLGAAIADLQAQIKADQEALQKAGAGGNVTFKFQRLQQAIQEDQGRRANMAELARRESEIERARQLRAQDLISPAEFERTQAAYRSQAAVSVDTGKIKTWRNEMDQMAEQLASQGGAASPTESRLQTLLLRSFDLDMQRVTAQQKVLDIGQALDMLTEVKARTRSVEKPSGALSPLMDAGAGSGGAPVQDRMSLQHVLTRVLTTHGSEGGVFEVVSEAEEPVYPVKSTRKLLAIAIFLALLGVGVVAVAGFEVLHPAVRSGAEVRARTDLPVAGVLPRGKREGLSLPWKPGSETLEAARLLADRLRSRMPRGGARVLITSPLAGHGAHLLTAHLAAALGQRGERVVILDADVREPRVPRGMDAISPMADEMARGIGDMLAGDRISLGELVLKTALTGAVLLPRGKAIGAPEALGGPRMREILEEATKQATVLLVVGAPVIPTVDAELLARNCDGVLLAAVAGRTRASDLKRAARRLESVNTPLLGVALVDVPRAFLDID